MPLAGRSRVIGVREVHFSNLFSKIVIFGESLTDIGILYGMFKGFMPKSPPYYYGRFCNGPVWADDFAHFYQNKGVQTHNFAVGGVTCIAHSLKDMYLPYNISNMII
ncbi:MAG: hypothetical protein GY750_03210 [Lentisphaerae bacterium]|nr:hypothetical protein [Lentisphaerota bacterium]MCP4100427.1 hypothetical protein [Lentisphaerota bacterium]